MHAHQFSTRLLGTILVTDQDRQVEGPYRKLHGLVLLGHARHRIEVAVDGDPRVVDIAPTLPDGCI
jgi:hypothetical protein